MRNNVKLYNALFPLWFVLFFPQTWIIVISGNFIIDSTVLLIAMAIIGIKDKWKSYLKTIWKVFLFGLLSDVIGSAYILLMTFGLRLGRMGDELYLTIPAIIISSICIFFFDYYISFKSYDKKVRIQLALTYAIVTAPYTFLVPSSWLYK